MQQEWSSQKISREFLRVNSCGFELARDMDIPTFRPMGRIDYHILHVVEGICRLEKNGVSKDISKGNIILFRPDEVQKYCFLAQHQSASQYIHFTGSGCEELLQRFLPVNQCVFYIGPSSSCKTTLERMIQEYVLKRPFYEDICASYLFHLLALIGRKLQYTSESKLTLPDKRIENICYRIHHEYAQNISLERYAEDCCLSLSRFLHLFKQNVGISPVQYRNQLRLDKAKDLLLYTDLAVKDVGELVGFADQNYFTRLFSSTLGCSPSQFRKRL